MQVLHVSSKLRSTYLKLKSTNASSTSSTGVSLKLKSTNASSTSSIGVSLKLKSTNASSTSSTGVSLKLKLTGVEIMSSYASYKSVNLKLITTHRSSTGVLWCNLETNVFSCKFNWV